MIEVEMSKGRIRRMDWEESGKYLVRRFEGSKWIGFQRGD